VTEPQTPRVRWGILSTGHIASVLTRDLALLPEEAEVVAVGSRSQEKADAFAEEHGLPKAFGSYEDLAADPDLDVIYVASVHNDHLASARLCLEAGKAVLVEKPLTTSEADTSALLDLARDRGLFLMEAMWSRTNPLLRKGRELVEAGELGPVRHVEATLGFRFEGPDTHRLVDPAQAGGAILDLGVYPVHLTQLFLGDPDELLAMGQIGSTGVDLHVTALLSHASRDGGPVATASIVCSLAADLPNRLEVFGEAASLRYDSLFLPSELILTRRGVDEPEVFVAQWPGGGYTFQVQEVMRCLRAGELESPLVPWADTLTVARTLDRWLASIHA
jgi:predicted dehydrogenase